MDVGFDSFASCSSWIVKETPAENDQKLLKLIGKVIFLKTLSAQL